MTGKDTDVKQLESFMDFYASRKAQVNKEKFKLDKDLEKISNEITQKSKELHADEESIQKRGVRVSIIVLADSAGEAELSLKYMVSGASWTPQYDLRAEIAADEKSKPSVHLHYRASISQSTGEDWTDVRLSLSTATPLRGSNIPSLKPLQVSEKVKVVPVTVSAAPQPVIIHTRSYSRSRSPSPERYRSRRKASMALPPPPSAPPAPPPPPPFFKPRVTEAIPGAISASFAISGLSTVPSGSGLEQKKHTVSIAEVHFDDVDLEWITVPKLQPTVFLRCKVKNTSEYALLPGSSSVFLNGSFVAKSTIPVSLSHSP